MTTLAHVAELRTPPRRVRIEIHVGQMRQLFNAMDPAPFRERDLDPKSEEFIVQARIFHRWGAMEVRVIDTTAGTG